MRMHLRRALRPILVVVLVLMSAAPASAESPTTVPLVELEAEPVTIEVTLEPGSSLTGVVEITGLAINRGNLSIEIADGAGYLVRLSTPNPDEVNRGLGRARVDWSSEQGEMGSRADFRIDPIDPLTEPAVVSITFNASAVRESFPEHAAIVIDPLATSVSPPATVTVAATRVVLEPLTPAARTVTTWDIPQTDQQWELLWVVAPGPRSNPAETAHRGGEVVLMQAASSAPCAREGACVGENASTFTLARGESLLDVFPTAIFWSPEPIDSGAVRLAMDMAPSAGVSGLVTLDATQPDVLIPVDLTFVGQKTLELHPAISVRVLEGDLFEPVDFSLDGALSQERRWRGDSRTVGVHPDMASFAFAIASRPAFRGDAVVEVTWSMVVFVVPEYGSVPEYGPVPRETVGITVGTPTRIDFYPDEPGDPSRPLGTPGWVYFGSALLLVAVAGSIVMLWRRWRQRARLSVGADTPAA